MHTCENETHEVTLLRLTTLLHQLALPALAQARLTITLRENELIHPLDGLESVMRQMAELTMSVGDGDRHGN